VTAIVEQVLTSIKSLRKEELELVMAEIKERLRRQRRMEEALQVFVGAGAGFWQQDAQEYVNELRSEDTAI
jgi:hypothetical protein